MEPVRSSSITFNKKRLVKFRHWWGLIAQGMILSYVSCLVPGRGQKKTAKKTTTNKSSALARHPALLCFILTLVESVYSGHIHLLNFKFKKKREKVLKPQGRVINLNIIFLNLMVMLSYWFFKVVWMPRGEYGSVMFTPETLRTQFPSNLVSTTPMDFKQVTEEAKESRS